MRNLASCTAVLGFAVVVAATTAHADPMAGVYEVKFQDGGTNCEHPLNYPQTNVLVKLEVKDGDLRVDIDRTPLMVGKPTKGGQFSAKSPRPGHTPIEGMDGEFRMAGRVTGEGMLSATMIGEYQSGGKPMCTQSWTLAGRLQARSDKGDRPDKDKPSKPKR